MAEKKWELVQKKAFTHWVNSYLERRSIEIEQIEDGFKNGVNLINFAEVLTKKSIEIKYQKQPKNKTFMVENCNLALKLIRDAEVKGMTASAEDFTDSNTKMILGFCWILLRHFRAPPGATEQTFEEGILQWVRDQLKDYEDVKITDFRSSFTDGKALLALNHKFDPSSVDYWARDRSSPLKNAETAIDLAETKMKVPSLFDANDLVQGNVSEKNMVLYLSLYLNAFQNAEEKRRLAGEGETKVLSVREQLKDALEQVTNLTNERDALRAARDALEKERNDLQTERDELLSQLAATKKAREELEAAFAREQKRNGQGLDELRKNLLEHLTDMNYWKDFLEQDREYRSEKIQLVKEKEIAGKSFDDQLVDLAAALGDEHKRMQALLKEREAEANKGLFSDEDKGKSTSTGKKSDRKDKDKDKK